MADNENKDVEPKKDSKFNAFVQKHGKKKLIIGTCGVVAVIVLIVGLSVGLTTCNKGSGSDSKSTIITGSTPAFSDDKKTCTYGIYPQTHVSDEATITALDALTSAESNGYYLYNNYYYAKLTAKPESNNNKFKDGSTIETDKNYWFRCDPISWKVLKVDSNSKYTLIADSLLDLSIFNESYSGKNSDGYYANNYAHSTLRSWLNGEFYNKAFTNNSYIQTTEVDNSFETVNDESEIGDDVKEYICENTSDKVYTLSYIDYLNADYGFNTDSSADDEAKYCYCTEYAMAKGAYYDDNKYYGEYWTRSPYSWEDYACGIRGKSIHYGKTWVNSSYYCARPAITISIN